MASDLGPTDVAAIAVISSRKAYDKFLGAARALDSSAVEECRADVALAYFSVQRGVENLLAQEAALSRLPHVKLEDLRTLPLLAQGLAFAVLQLHHNIEAASFGPLFAQAQRIRRKLLKTADALAEAGLLAPVDAEAVPRLSQHDVIGACMSFAQLLRRNEARIVGHSPVTDADLKEAEHLTAKLRGLLAPRGEPEEGVTLHSVMEATQLRDRLWTLLKQRHDLLWRCGAWIYGQEVNERVPPLQAVYAALPATQAVRLPPSVEPPPEKPNPMRLLQQKFRALVSVSVGRPPR